MTDDELLTRLYMADDSKDDDPELEKLRQLRAVWLALPEDEPPQHGMAELMAAARAKAVEMRPRASWWQTLLATLRRPPVLALATVMVLVGGAVFVGRRSADVEVPANAPRTPPAGTIARGPVNGATPGMAADEAAGSAADNNMQDRLSRLREEASGSASNVTVTAPQVANPAPADKSGKDVVDEKVTPPRKEPVSKAEPVRRPTPPAAHIATKPKVSGKGDDAEADRRDAPARSDQSAHGGGGGDSGASGAAQQDPSQQPPATPIAPSQEQPAQPAAPPPPARVTTPSTQAESVDQLVKQCQTAAARGDCSAVKLLAARIAKADAARYRDKVSKDAAVAKCLLAE